MVGSDIAGLECGYVSGYQGTAWLELDIGRKWK